MRRLAFLVLAAIAVVPVITTIDSQAQLMLTHHVREAVRSGQVRVPLLLGSDLSLGHGSQHG